MTKPHIVYGRRPEELTGELAERVKALVYEYSGRVTLAAAVGTLTIVIRELVDEAE